jgi:hypothetical protein
VFGIRSRAGARVPFSIAALFAHRPAQFLLIFRPDCTAAKNAKIIEIRYILRVPRAFAVKKAARVGEWYAVCYTAAAGAPGAPRL